MKNIKTVYLNNCAGCAACTMVCSQNAISMKTSYEGFWEASIDYEKCISCGLCQKVCPENDSYLIEENNQNQRYYAVRNRNLNTVKISSSGGVFTALAQTVLEQRGIVYGVVINYPECNIVYKRATSIDEIAAMRGSKYIQAELPSRIIDSVINDVQERKIVLFTGTSCHVNGLKKILEHKRISMDTIIFMDFVCAGVISVRLWDRIIQKYHQNLGNIVDVKFRDKNRGWRNYSFSLTNGRKKESVCFPLSEVGLLQSDHESLGRSCNNCKYRSYERPGDITVGDFWNEQYLPHKWWDDKGVSMVIINTERGEKLFEQSKSAQEYIPVDKKMVFSERFIKKSFQIDEEKRREMYSDADRLEYQQFKNKWMKVSFKEKIVFEVIRPLWLKLGIYRFRKQ